MSIPDKFAFAVAFVFSEEGGYSNRNAKDDPGKATNFGITIATLSKWRGRDVTPADVIALTRAEAETIYRTWFWLAAYDLLPISVAICMLDTAVNSGGNRAAKILQYALNIPADGIIGPATMAAVRKYSVDAIVDAFCDERMAFLRSLSNWEANKNGWTSRVANLRALGHKYADQP